MSFQEDVLKNGVVWATCQVVEAYTGMPVHVNRTNLPSPYKEFMVRLGTDLVVVSDGDTGCNDYFIVANEFKDDAMCGVSAGGFSLDNETLQCLADFAYALAEAVDVGTSWRDFKRKM